VARRSTKTVSVGVKIFLA